MRRKHQKRHKILAWLKKYFLLEIIVTGILFIIYAIILFVMMKRFGL